MFISDIRYGRLLKAIAAAVVCTFLVNDIAWADSPPDLFNPLQSATLAPESRLKSFFERHGLDFKNTATVMLAAGQLRNMIATGGAGQGNIMRLNQLFSGGEVEIEKDIKQGNLRCSGRTYDYAVFHFKKKNKTVNALFIKDYDKLTDDELREFGVKTAEDKRYFNSSENPALKGVWFKTQQDIWSERAAEVVENARNCIIGDIRDFDPQVAQKKESFLAILYHAAQERLDSIASKTAKGKLKIFARMNLMNLSPEKQSGELDYPDEEIKVVLMTSTANPLTWGHILTPLVAMDELNADFIVLQAHGKMEHKEKLYPSERVSVAHRHHMVRESIDRLSPLMRYTDLGSEDDDSLEAAAQMHRLLALNPNRKVHIFFLIGAESEARMNKYIRQHYQMFKENNFGHNPNHKITFTVTQRGEYGKRVTLEELLAISRQAQKELACEQFLDIALIQHPHMDLGVASTYYRVTQDGAFVPKPVHEFSKRFGYYGHSPIDPLTGKPFYSQEESFRKKIGPVAKELAAMIYAKIKAGIAGDTPFVSVDGGSGSGKSTLGAEVAKILSEEYGLESRIIGFDMWLKDRKWRIAIQKLVKGDRLTSEEMKIAGELINRIKPREIFFGEEGFFKNEEILATVKELDNWRNSSSDTHTMAVKDAYIREKGTREDVSIGLKKGQVIIFDGKYANTEELQPYYDLRFRLHDSPDRTEARFQIRSRKYNPDDADIQVVFYKLALIPSYEAYDKRTESKIHGFIDLREEGNWFLETNSAVYALPDPLDYPPEKFSRVFVESVYKNSLNEKTKKEIRQLFGAIQAERLLPKLYKFFENYFFVRKGRFNSQNAAPEIRSSLMAIPGYCRESTKFFRFDHDKKTVQKYFAKLIDEKVKKNDLTVTAKSVGISSGEEPYSIAMHIYYAMKKYYQSHNMQKDGFRTWLLKWKIRVEAYDKDLVSLCLARNGLFDFQYDEPLTENADPYYDNPWLINGLDPGETWSKRAAQGMMLPFREPALNALKASGRSKFDFAFQADPIIRGWIKPIYVNIRSRDDMPILTRTKANVVIVGYLNGSRMLGDENRYIEDDLKKAVDTDYPALLCFGDTEVGKAGVNPQKRPYLENTPFNLVRDEERKIHAENLKYTPPVANNTVLCHIVAPSILPEGQRGMLNRLDSGMRSRKYIEKMLELKTDGSGDFIEQIKDTMQRTQKIYEKAYGKDYVNYTFKFDIACPNLDLVRRVQVELGLPALAFAPEEGGGNMVQAENIMLALRALRISMETNDIQILINAYVFITGNRAGSGIKNIAKFTRTKLFAMPKVNVDELGRINALIEKNIKTAA